MHSNTIAVCKFQSYIVGMPTGSYVNLNLTLYIIIIIIDQYIISSLQHNNHCNVMINSQKGFIKRREFVIIHVYDYIAI